MSSTSKRQNGSIWLTMHTLNTHTQHKWTHSDIHTSTQYTHAQTHSDTGAPALILMHTLMMYGPALPMSHAHRAHIHTNDTAQSYPVIIHMVTRWAQFNHMVLSGKPHPLLPINTRKGQKHLPFILLSQPTGTVC